MRTPQQITSRRLGYRAVGAELFWTFQYYGRSGILFHRAVRRDVLAGFGPATERRPSAVRGLPLVPAAALGRRRTGLDVAETGRQPWTIDGVLPTFLSVSSVPARQRHALARRIRHLRSGAGGRGTVPDGAHGAARSRGLCRRRTCSSVGIPHPAE